MTEEACGLAAMQGLIDYLGPASRMFTVYPPAAGESVGALADFLPVARLGTKIVTIRLDWADLARFQEQGGAEEFVRLKAKETIASVCTPDGELRPAP